MPGMVCRSLMLHCCLRNRFRDFAQAGSETRAMCFHLVVNQFTEKLTTSTFTGLFNILQPEDLFAMKDIDLVITDPSMSTSKPLI